MITPKLICEFNRQILKEAHYAPEVVPGAIRTEQVVVGSYRAPPAADCQYLLDRPGESTLGFLSYAIEGFVVGMREAIDMVRTHQIEVSWVNYVHDRFASQPNTKAASRQRSLVLAMPMDAAVPRTDLDGLTPKLARLYANAGPRTLSRDLNTLLIKLGLIRRVRRGYIARSDVVQALLPPVAAGNR